MKSFFAVPALVGALAVCLLAATHGASAECRVRYIIIQEDVDVSDKAPFSSSNNDEGLPPPLTRNEIICVVAAAVLSVGLLVYIIYIEDHKWYNTFLTGRANSADANEDGDGDEAAGENNCNSRGDDRCGDIILIVQLDDVKEKNNTMA